MKHSFQQLKKVMKKHSLKNQMKMSKAKEVKVFSVFHNHHMARIEFLDGSNIVLTLEDTYDLIDRLVGAVTAFENGGTIEEKERKKKVAHENLMKASMCNPRVAYLMLLACREHPNETQFTQVEIHTIKSHWENKGVDILTYEHSSWSINNQ